MRKLILGIVSQCASLATFLGFLLTIDASVSKYSGWQWVMVIACVAISLLAIYLVCVDYRNERPLILTTETQIRDYMYKWIKSSGRTVIFTRDLSWVVDNEMKLMLKNKASEQELIICMPERNKRVMELEASGAIIIEYGDLDYIPKSRFTITNFERNDSRIAVGKSVGSNKHMIEEFASGGHPYFDVATDLVNILKKHSENL